MGMYTEFSFSADLKPLPDDVATVIDFLVDKDVGEPLSLPDHEFFQCHRWRFIACKGMAVYMHMLGSRYEYQHLSIASSIKNHDDDYGKFLNWIAPYVLTFRTPTFVGYTRYEEADDPTLHYVHDGRVVAVYPDFAEKNEVER